MVCRLQRGGIVKQVDRLKLYFAFGLTFSSEIDFPELINIETSRYIDVTIKEEDLTEKWLEYGDSDKVYVIKEKFWLFKVPNVAIYCIQEGKQIIVSPLSEERKDLIRLYLLGTCMGALLMQRRILPLHGSAIEINGKAYAIVGDSGAGKSTTAAAFLRQGYRFISDDVIPVSLNDRNVPIVCAAYPQQKLWQESINEFGMDSKLYRPIFEREKKYAIPVSEQFVDNPLPLAGIIELVKKEDEKLGIYQIHKLERLQTIFNHTYRNFFILPAGLLQWHFHTSTTICEAVKLFRIQRPPQRFTAYDLTEMIISTCNEEEIIYG